MGLFLYIGRVVFLREIYYGWVPGNYSIGHYLLPTSTSCLTTAAALERRTGSGSWCTQRTGHRRFRNVYSYISDLEREALAGLPRGCSPQPQAVRPTQISCYLTSFRPDMKRLPTPWTSRSLHRLLRSASRRDVLWVIPMCLWRSSELSG